MIITIKDIDKIIKKLKINMDYFNFNKNDLLKGCLIELEHGKKYKLTNITNDNIELTFKIALAHLYEFPDYYERLQKMENKADKFWKNKNKFNISSKEFM
jgi:hypothetical protein